MKYTTEIFKEKATEIHKNDKVPPIYDKVEYINSTTKVCITCPIHGDYWQTPKNHLQGHGCPLCNNFKKATENFISEAKEVHKNDEIQVIYDETEYNGYHRKVKLICPIHGEFWQLPKDHLRGSSCPECAYERYRKTTEQFIKKSKEVHKNDDVQIIYDEVEYKGVRKKVKLICPIHGEFWQYPKVHLRGASCPKCSGNKRKTTEEFIKEAEKIHKDNIIFDEVEYVNAFSKIKLICPKHGVFLSTPHEILKGQGCPICNESHLEKNTRNILTKNNIEFIPQYRNKEIFAMQSLDFYLPKLKIGIECQGIQHYQRINFFADEEKYKKCLELDKRKYQFSKKHNIQLYYIFDDKANLENIYNEIYNINNSYHISDFQELLNKINSEKNEFLA